MYLFNIREVALLSLSHDLKAEASLIRSSFGEISIGFKPGKDSSMLPDRFKILYSRFTVVYLFAVKFNTQSRITK